jgi:lysophospholipase L1-like esterase
VKTTKINKGKRGRIWWISIFVVAITAYGLGLVTGRYGIFPYQIIKHAKNTLIDKKKKSLRAEKKRHSRIYRLDKKSFFEINGTESDIVMIGSSLIDRAEWNELFPDTFIVNRGIGGDTTKGVLNRMESIFSTNAKKAFIMIGLNDLAKNISVDEICNNYKKIVSQLRQHGIRPYIQSVLLVGDKFANRNKNIVKLNLKLKELSEEENIVFIDLNKVLFGNGTQRESFLSEDGIHLTGEGYSVWKNSIKKYIQ